MNEEDRKQIRSVVEWSVYEEIENMPHGHLLRHQLEYIIGEGVSRGIEEYDRKYGSGDERTTVSE